MITHNRLSVAVTRVLLLSIFVCCLVVGLFWYFITAEQVRVPYMPPYDLPEENTTVGVGMDYALESPLFWESRRPVPELESQIEEPVQIQVGPIAGVKLLGIIIRDSVRTALLGVDKNNIKVVKGDEVNGWLVEQVFADKVVLIANGQTAELSIVRERPDSIKLEPVAH